MSASIARPSGTSLLQLVFTAWLLQLGMRASEGKAVLELKMMNYDNSEARKWSGSYCYGFYWIRCDHFFKFGLDLSAGDDNVDRFYYWSYRTGTFGSANVNTFNLNMQGVNNPITTIFNPSWPGSVKLKVTIQNDGGCLGNDLVDKIVWKLESRPATSVATTGWTLVTMSGMRSRARTSLTMAYRLYCQPNYYAADCSVFCEARDLPSGHYTCDPATGNPVCRPGWRDPSSMCTKTSDNCIGNLCRNGSTCINGASSYTCACAPGFTGAYCNVNTNECASNPCLNGGSCIDLVAGYRCTCPPAFVGPTCSQPYCSVVNPCRNGGTCYGAGQCQCATGFIGSDCSINRCETVACRNGGTCFNGTCVCPADFTGPSCGLVQCTMASYCLNGGSCFNGTCTCLAAFTGQHCETNVDECASNPCLNGGSCIDLVAGYRCTCPPAFVGPTCSQPYCDVTSPCLSGGTCYGAGQCSCTARFYGPTCSVDRCDVVPCENGGSCLADGTCECPAGFIGRTCEVDQCSVMCCQNGGQCYEGQCKCAPGFTGSSCETNIDDCVNNPCLNNGTCDDQVDSFSCRCLPNWTGLICSQSRQPVQNPDPSTNATTEYLQDQPIIGSNVAIVWFYASFGVIFLLLVVIIILSACLCRRRFNRLQNLAAVAPMKLDSKLPVTVRAENAYVEKPTKKIDSDDNVFGESTVSLQADNVSDDPVYETIKGNSSPSPPPRYSTIDESPSNTNL